MSPETETYAQVDAIESGTESPKLLPRLLHPITGDFGVNGGPGREFLVPVAQFDTPLSRSENGF